MSYFPETRAAAEISTAALAANFALLSAYATMARQGQQTRLIAVVKANAYGHGMALTVEALRAAGCDFFAVATLEEAETVRKIATRADVLILGYTPPQQAARLSALGLTQTVFSTTYAKALCASAAAAGCTVPIHIKIEGGMCRLGFAAERVEEIVAAATQEHLLPTGIYTHFPSADTDIPATHTALCRFLCCKRALASRGLSLFAHAAASAALLTLPETVLDGARVGLALYGIAPVKTALALQPALTLTAPIVQLREVPCGTPVGYGGSFVTERATRLGTVPIGYGDGVPRALGTRVGRASLFAGGRWQAVPIAGNICMDQMMVDVTETNAKIGDRVRIFDDISANAAALDTIPYELLCRIGERVIRKKKD